MVDLGLKTLLHDKLKFAITVAGVAFAVTLVLAQVGLFVGLLDNSNPTIRNASADLWITSHNTANVDFPQRFPETLVDRVRSTPGVSRADNLIVTYMTVQLPSGAAENTVVYALKDFRAWNLPWDIKDGQVEDLRRGRFFILDEKAARRFGRFETGDYREVQETRMKIVGQSKGALSFTTNPISFMDYDLVQSLQPDFLGGKTSYILVKLAPGANLETVRGEIQRRLPYNDVFTKKEWAKKSQDYWIVNTGIGMNAYLTVFLGCLVGLVVVAQTLYTSTMEHIKEFGTVKAIGGSNADIYKILARQASVAAVVGFVIGLALSMALVPLAAKVDLKLIMPLPFIAVVGIGTVLLCLGASMLSFRKVANIDPGLVFRA
jgi:putative ABC transport system permease protein